MDNPEKLATQGIQDEDKQHKNTTQYVLYNVQTNTNNVNMTCALLQTTGGKDGPNILFYAENVTDTTARNS